MRLILPVLLALSPLQVQVGAQVRTEAGVVSYTENQDQDVPIALPTNRYTCVRRPVLHQENTVVVLITCSEGPRQAFVIGTACDATQPSANESVVSVNVSKNNTPKPVVFTVACRTLPPPTFL